MEEEVNVERAMPGGFEDSQEVMAGSDTNLSLQTTLDSLCSLSIQGNDDYVEDLNSSSTSVDDTKETSTLIQECSGDNSLDVTLSVDSENSLNEAEAFNIPLLEKPDFKLDSLCNPKALGDGSDSGVEIGHYYSASVFQRALSTNSGGYASSGGLEDSMTANTTPAVSCDSSLISCYSTCGDSEDFANSTTILLISGGDGTSEGGSESSSIAGRDVVRSSRSASIKRTVANVSVKKKDSCKSHDGARVKSASSSIATPLSSRQSSAKSAWGSSRSASTCRRDKTSTPLSDTKLNSPVKQPQGLLGSRPSPRITGALSRHGRTTEPPGVAARKEVSAISKVRSLARSNLGPKAKLPVGDDGRWPSRTQSRTHAGSACETLAKKMTSSLTSSLIACGAMESKASALEKYATLPRRRKHKSPETPVSDHHQRSHSVSRDPSLNRAASLRKQHHQREVSVAFKSLPPYPRKRAAVRTRIYHEICVQTALSGKDVANALAGVGFPESAVFSTIEKSDKEVQVEKNCEELQLLEARLKQLTHVHSQLQIDCDRQKQHLDKVEQLLSSEKAEKLALQEQLDRTNKRVLAMLGNLPDEADQETGSLEKLENHLQSSGRVVIKQQHEISDLQMLCRTLQRDLEKSLAAQKMLLQQQQEIEVESMELQEFLQAEKSTLADALKDAETEVSNHKQLLTHRELELQRQQEECKHLVRISEQRRQENLALQARLSGLEKRSRELLLQQGAAVSGAAVALSGLSTRLDGLVEQLVTAYNISEKDLEDVIFHNEAYSKSNSNSSVEASPEKTPVKQIPEYSSKQSSPKRGASFVTAVIAAIRNAASQSPFSNSASKNVQTEITSIPRPHAISPDSSSGSAELLDSEKDPCIVIDNDDDILSDTANVTTNVPESHVASSKSLQSLSQAILVRQQSEMAQAQNQCGMTSSDLVASTSYDSCEDISSSLVDYCSAATLVDQIIDVDNLVTRLLKVLRIIQLENETCIEELHDERVQLAEQIRQEQDSKRDMQEQMNNWESLSGRLRNELEEARMQMHLKIKELEETKADLLAHKEQVEHLSQDICNLSSLCQHSELQLQRRETEAENALQQWQKNGQIPSADVLSRIITARNEIPGLKKELAEKEKQLAELSQKSSINKQLLTDNWHRAISEVRRQYDTIDRALETLQSIQSIVMQCPPLAKMQQELEERNFQSLSSLPLVAADLNANAALVTSNNTCNGDSNRLNSVNTINGSL